MVVSKGQATGMCAIKMGNYTFLKTAKGPKLYPPRPVLSQAKKIESKAHIRGPWFSPRVPKGCPHPHP